MADASVPERKRLCPHCNAKLTREAGFCPMCGNEYSFLPTLKAGEIVGGQYEIKGPMAFGGLGWIYLGWDTLLSRWVVLKGLLNVKDAASAQAAVAERKFLAAVKHPNIVGVYNFVSDGPHGYIVMEYVGGKSLKTLRQERGPLPPAEAVAFIHRILGAFIYMENKGLVYCDFKPDNFMLEDDDVKLIDMGGVRRVDDPGGDVYGTRGYSAPEASQEPSFASDQYTVARTLAVLLTTFDVTNRYEYSLPTPAEEPLFAAQESLYRWLLKATRTDPDARFSSFEEASEELLGVLREIVAQTATPKPHDSPYFLATDVLPDDDEDDDSAFSSQVLPALKVDANDPAASALISLSVGGGARHRVAELEQLAASFPESVEVPLRRADASLEAGDFETAQRLIGAVEAADPFDWRAKWYRGKCLLAQGSASEARGAFDAVYSEVPGEIVPKLALGVCAEQVNDRANATRFYDLVSRTDPSYNSAAFGLARVLASSGNRFGAVSALGRVPPSSSQHLRAQTALARTLLDAKPGAPGETELEQAGRVIEALRGQLDGARLHRLSADLLLVAARGLESKLLGARPDQKLLGQRLDTRALREGAERELRACAHFAKETSAKIALVDEANRERPHTMI